MSSKGKSQREQRPVVAKDDKSVSRSSSSEISQFINVAGSLNPENSGRLIFSLDATMSRQPTWDRACQLQASMFDAVARIGGLAVQLVYFRGFGECRASKWVMNSRALRDLMTGIDCRGGQTQLIKVFSHANKETDRKKIDALVFIGDAMEEDVDRLCQMAGQLGIKGVKAFMFQEGHDRVAETAFREIARLTNGAWFRLGPSSASELADLLGAIAVYASGGHKALEARSGAGAKLLVGKLSESGSPGRGN